MKGEKAELDLPGTFAGLISSLSLRPLQEKAHGNRRRMRFRA
jgi:hypothetical protein